MMTERREEQERAEMNDLCICGVFARYECCNGKHTFPLLHIILILLSCKACDVS